MKTKGKFLFEKRWYSYCSMHCEHEENCPDCNNGHWYYTIRYKIESLICKISKKLYSWYVYKR